MNTLGRFQNVSLEGKATKKPIPHLFCLPISTTPCSHSFFNLFHATGFEKAAAPSKQLCYPHQGICESQLHSITSRSIWFSSACLPTLLPCSVPYWVGVKPRPAGLSCVQPTLFGSTWGRDKTNNWAGRAQSIATPVNEMVTKSWGCGGAQKNHFPAWVCLSFKELCEHRFCRRKQQKYVSIDAYAAELCFSCLLKDKPSPSV